MAAEHIQPKYMTFVFLMGDFFFFFNQRFLLVNFFFCNGGLVGRERRRLSIFVHLHVESHGAPQDLLHLFFFFFSSPNPAGIICVSEVERHSARAHTHTHSRSFKVTGFTSNCVFHVFCFFFFLFFILCVTIK